MGRDLELCRNFAAAWFGDQLASTPSTVSDYFHTSSAALANFQPVLSRALAYRLLEPY